MNEGRTPGDSSKTISMKYKKKNISIIKEEKIYKKKKRSMKVKKIKIKCIENCNGVGGGGWCRKYNGNKMLGKDWTSKRTGFNLSG